MAGIDEYTRLLLHCDGVDESTTFIDSALGKTITANGNVQIDTAIKKFGSGAGLFDGTGDYLSTSDHADWALGTTNFTIDFWVRALALQTNNAVFGDYTDATHYNELIHNSTNGWYYQATNGGVIASITETTSPISTGTWIHIAIVRNGSTFTLYENGISIGTDTDAGTMPNNTTGLYIGYNYYLVGSSVYWNGWIDEFRWSKGIARWTANFTPPTKAYSEEVGGGILNWFFSEAWKKHDRIWQPKLLLPKEGYSY